MYWIVDRLYSKVRPFHCWPSVRVDLARLNSHQIFELRLNVPSTGSCPLKSSTLANLSCCLANVGFIRTDSTHQQQVVLNNSAKSCTNLVQIARLPLLIDIRANKIAKTPRHRRMSKKKVTLLVEHNKRGFCHVGKERRAWSASTQSKFWAAAKNRERYVGILYLQIQQQMTSEE